MQNNQSIHIHIKQPHTSKEAIRTIGIFPASIEKAQLTAILTEVLFTELDGIKPDITFERDLVEEVLKLLAHSKVLSVARNVETNLTMIILREEKTCSPTQS